MQCPHCGADNPEGVTYCIRCARPLTAAPAGVPAAPTAAGNPWETPGQPLVQAWLDTVKAVAITPADFFRGLPPTTGDLLRPFLFALICGLIGQIFAYIYNAILNIGLFGVQQMPMMGATTLLGLILFPFGLAIGLAIATLIFHLLLSLFGAANQPLEATYRVIAYSTVNMLANVVPFIGWLIGAIWVLFLYIVGFREVHRTTTGKAALAVLVPTALICLCVLLLVGVAGVALFRAFQQGL